MKLQSEMAAPPPDLVTPLLKMNERLKLQLTLERKAKIVLPNPITELSQMLKRLQLKGGEAAALRGGLFGGSSSGIGGHKTDSPRP